MVFSQFHGSSSPSFRRTTERINSPLGQDHADVNGTAGVGEIQRLRHGGVLGEKGLDKLRGAKCWRLRKMMNDAI